MMIYLLIIPILVSGQWSQSGEITTNAATNLAAIERMIMSRAFDAKGEAKLAYPEDQEAGVELFLNYLDMSEEDFVYEFSQSPKEYIYGN